MLQVNISLLVHPHDMEFFIGIVADIHRDQIGAQILGYRLIEIEVVREWLIQL